VSLEIPEKYHDGLRTLLEFTDSDVNSIVSALTTVSASAPTDQLAVSVRASFSDRSPSEMYDAIRALRALYGVYSNSDLPLKTFLSALVVAMQDVVQKPLTPARRKAMTLRLSHLLGVEKVAIYAKMQNLNSGESSYCKARINTDLRPVFIGGEEAPRNYMLVHRLQLGFHSEDGEHKDFFVTLDNEDLQNLRVAIDTAEKQATRLQKSVQRLIE
jgi:hypothetical protein